MRNLANGAGSLRSTRRRSSLLAVLCAVGLSVGAACSTQSGSEVAANEADQLIERLSAGLSREPSGSPAEHLAATLTEAELRHDDDLDATLVLLGWGGAETPRWIDVAVSVRVGARSAGTFERGTPAGSAKRCYRLSVEPWGAEVLGDRSCDAEPLTSVPTTTPTTPLPNDTVERVTQAMRSADAASLDALVHSVFPESTGADPAVTVTTEVHDGEFVAAIGSPSERDCVVVVLGIDGSISTPYFERIWAQPGELGCSTQLYTAPPS